MPLSAAGIEPLQKAQDPRVSAGRSGALEGVSTAGSIPRTVTGRDRRDDAWTRKKVALLRAFAATLSGAERDIVTAYLRRVEGPRAA